MVTFSEEDFTVTSFIDVNTPEKILCDDDMDSYVLALVEQLPAQYKIVINLYHVEGMQYEEIGTITGMPSGTVKSYLFRARTLLKEKVKLLIEKDDEYEFRR
jgi:RNA polymerase sigma-70 factor (ECF subfamily)